MFIQRVRQRMSEAGITQAELVRKTGLSKSGVSQYLSGKSKPSEKALQIIADALNVNIEWLTTADKLTVQQAAALMGMDAQSVRVGMRVGALPIGSVWKAEGAKKYTYYVSPKKFTEFTGIRI